MTELQKAEEEKDTQPSPDTRVVWRHRERRRSEDNMVRELMFRLPFWTNKEAKSRVWLISTLGEGIGGNGGKESPPIGNRFFFFFLFFFSSFSFFVSPTIPLFLSFNE